MAKKNARERLLDAATKLFVEKTYEGTSVRDICSEAGTTVNMVSHYFGGKRKLYEEIFNGLSTDVFMGPVALLEQRPDTREELEWVLTRFSESTFDALLENKEAYILASREQVLSKSMHVYQRTFIDFMTEAQEKGLIRKEVDPEMISGFIAGRLASQIIDADWIKKVTGTDIISDKKYRERWMKANLDVIFHGIVTP